MADLQTQLFQQIQEAKKNETNGAAQPGTPGSNS